ncbi:hypothetical protein RMATCC62417_02548 [Rhizopus microsporus]|nr:hypothetical protein RMATCC62417_02548 [Rhizopus microsporus]
MKNMGWQTFSLLYSADALGDRVADILSDRGEQYGFYYARSYRFSHATDESIEQALTELNRSGSRIVILAFSRSYQQVNVLRKAREMGLMSKGWVWMVADDLANNFLQNIKDDDDGDVVTAYNGLMYISTLWNLTGLPAFDEFQAKWRQQPVPSDYSDPSNWTTTSLNYGAAQAYSCLELLTLGINKALDQYSGGREKGLQDLASDTFNTSSMTPMFYNFNYSGPAGNLTFTDTGDLQNGYFRVFYLQNGIAVPYANIRLDSYESINDHIIYPGNTHEKPPDIAIHQYMNPTPKSPLGIAILTVCGVGLFFCLLMTILIFLHRHLKPIMISSPVFCYLQLLGISMCYITLILLVRQPTPATCVSRQFLFCMGFTFVVGSIIAKNYRIYKIYQNVFTIRTSRLKSTYLLRLVGIFQIFVVVPLAVWNIVYRVQVISYQLFETDFCWICEYPTAENGQWGRFNLAQMFVLIWLFLLILTACFLAFKTRDVSSKWSETTQIAYVSYNLIVSASVMVPGLILGNDYYDISLYLYVASLMFGSTFTLITIFIPKFVVISRHILQNSKKFNIYRMNSDSQNQMSIHSTNSMDQNIQLNLVAKNMYDFTVQAHEGILPVKKMAKFDFLSIWTLKHVVLVPFKKYFILSEKSGENATVYHYVSCEPALVGSTNHFTFRVRTDKSMYFLFQVYDRESLDRWVNWFNRDPSTERGISPNAGRNNADNNNDPDDPPTSPDRAAVKVPKSESATFGNMQSEMLYNSSTPSFQQNSSIPQSYPTSSSLSRSAKQGPVGTRSITSPYASYVTNSNFDVSGAPPVTSPYTSFTASNPNFGRGNLPSNQQNSFGVINENAWQRYP